jgi:microsomal epoxide hydrolase
MPEPEGIDQASVSDHERQGLLYGQKFMRTGTAYALEHATRPSTIGLVLGSNPLALLAWIGEKFLEWSDQDPPLDTILESVTLYWLTETLPRAIYPYREVSHLSIPIDLTLYVC